MLESLWKDTYRRLDFEFEGRKAILIFPHPQNATKKWLLKTEYFSAFQELESAMVEKGYHLAYLENKNRWGIDADLDAKYRFRNFLMAEYGLSPRCIPIGMSCGGLHAIKQAAKYPDMVSVLYLDAPVVNLFSCPFGMGAGTNLATEAQQEALDALGLTRRQMITYRDHPLDHLPDLVRYRLPVALVCGDADQTVLYEENGALIKALYEKEKLPFYFLLKPGCDHHPHGPGETYLPQAVAFLQTWDR